MQYRLRYRMKFELKTEIKEKYLEKQGVSLCTAIDTQFLILKRLLFGFCPESVKEHRQKKL